MKLHSAMTLAADYDVATDSGFSQQVFKALQAGQPTPAMPLPLQLACTQIELTCHPNVLMRRPLKSIKIVAAIEAKDIHKSGRYLPLSEGGPTILLRENAALRMFCLQVFFHEYGHHLDDVFLKDDTYRLPAVQEFETEKARVQKVSGVSIGSTLDDYWQKLWRAGTAGVSTYSLRNINEWFAEAFALYISGYATVLEGVAPKTARAVQAVCTGVLL